jgi:hypothetical protein
VDRPTFVGDDGSIAALAFPAADDRRVPSSSFPHLKKKPRISRIGAKRARREPPSAVVVDVPRVRPLPIICASRRKAHPQADGQSEDRRTILPCSVKRKFLLRFVEIRVIRGF